MKRFFSALAFCVSLLVLLCLFLFPPVKAKDNTLLILLNLPAPAPPNPQVRRTSMNPDSKFYSKANPPKDNAPIEEILDYWNQQNNSYRDLDYNPSPSDTVQRRILDEVGRDPKLLVNYINVLDGDAVADVARRIYEDPSSGLDKETKRTIRQWLIYNSPQFSDELERTAGYVSDSNEYVTNQRELLALTHVDFQKALPIINRIYNDPTQPVSQTLAKWALYKHALDTDSLGDIDRYRDELKAVVEDKNATAGMRDLAFDGLVKEKDWSGRDEWYFSLLGDETLADLRVNGQSYTGLTTIISYSPPDKYTGKMLELLKSGNSTVKAAAIRNLVLRLSADNPEVVRALVPWLEDPNWAIDRSDSRGALVRILGEVQIPESVPGLIKVLDERASQSTSPGRANMAVDAVTRVANMSNAVRALPGNVVMAANSNAVRDLPTVSYPYRYSALNALAVQKDIRAVPALRRLLPEGEIGYERSMVVKAILACGGFTVAEQMDALEAGIKRENGEAESNTNAPYYPAVNQPGRVTQAEINLLLSQQLMQATEISDELARAIVDRIESLDTRDPKLAAAYRRTILKWQNAAINVLLLRDLKRDMAGPDEIVRLLGQRAFLREKQSTDVSDIRTGRPIAVGTAACLLEDTNDYAAILDSGDAETKTAMLACARLIRAPLAVSKVAEDLGSPNKMLALAAERYLESEDSVEARRAVLARHPGEARLMGAMTTFEGDEGATGGTEYLWLLYQSLGDNSLYYGWGGSGNDSELKAAEKHLQDEVKKDADLLGIYAYDGNYIRFYSDRVIFSWDDDRSRYHERPLTKEEYDEVRSYITSNKADELPPFVACGGGYCVAKELIMLGRNGGRRVYVNGDYAGSSYPFFAGLEEYFKKLKQTRATLKYSLSREIPGLEILLASDDLHAATVWKDGNELKVAASDTAVRKRVKDEIENSDPEGDVANEEGVSDETEQKKIDGSDKRRFEGYAWYRVVDGEASGSTQPPGVEFIPPPDGLSVPADEQQWKAHNVDVEYRTSDDGLFKVVRGKLTKLRDGTYNSAVLVPGGRWLMASKTDVNGVEICVRVNLLTNREFPVAIEGYGQRYPAAYIPTLNKVLVVRDDSYEGEGEYDGEPPAEEDDTTPEDDDPSGMLLVDPATGATQPIAGEFRPMSQQTFRPLQRTGRLNEYWAAIPDTEKNMTEVGIYDINHFGFRTMVRIPQIRFNSMDMFVDEPGGKVYFVYRGHLLALPLPK